ncbi:MAG: ribbon-helix-helix domain-containing protein [Cuspidothrix sp.]
MLMSKKFSVTLPDAIFHQLEDMAQNEGRTTANLAAYLIESGIREILKQAKKQNQD